MESKYFSNQNTMAYFARFSQTSFVSALWMLTSLLNVNRHFDYRTRTGFEWVFFFIFFWSLFLPQLLTVLYFVLLKKPIFTANELYIYDHYEGIKYYWEDIEEIVADLDNIEVKLIDPVSYLKNRKRLFSKFRAMIKYYIFNSKPKFIIDTQFIIIKKGEHKLFIDALNNLSITAGA